VKDILAEMDITIAINGDRDVKTTILKSLLLGVAITSSSFVMADDYTTSDVVGMFANLSHTGALANTKTVMQAHLECMGSGGDVSTNSSGSSTYESEYSDSYKDCMAKYVPFRVTGSDEAGACASEEVTWGQCRSTLPTGSEGALYSLRNDSDNSEYEGVAAFQCENTSWVYKNGGCSSAAQACEEGQLTSWDVTTPIWADQNENTVYVDRFGQVRHDPQSGCYARMGAANSGELVYPSPTSPETSPSSSYNFGDSSSPQRCFDNDWIEDPTGGTPSCEFVPDNCSATTYSHPNGCSFSIPALDHDEIYTNTNPSPSLSTGSVQAYCWNGEVEIKSSSCNKSCATNVVANVWDWDYDSGEVTPRRCAHSAINSSERIAPSGGLSVANVTDGLTGTSYYTCKNGVLSLDAETCAPDICTSIPENSWSNAEFSCSHDAFVMDLPHGASTAKTSYNFATEVEGVAQYTCSYGNIVTDSLSCTGTVGQTLCYASEVDPSNPVGGDDGTGVPFEPNVGVCGILGFDGRGYYEDENQCCKIQPDGDVHCYEIP
jgi:hypothetical protein